ncbi:hypothetical protein [Clostridium cellulovorans]|uniref:Uncharacterized protein n=1 Tax=Clostridium cellulovorans (strain ATCC 35296 / DSM 3052 / OCM 3 / 743B) TaxID=573061 RepID=D9SPT2_CLOC7|nr:hypothetical protein [Clostridium cellulovorans]ADL52068.1 hypothetical protein Clocel_2351 [Clostridium cellulovorans 743B]
MKRNYVRIILIPLLIVSLILNIYNYIDKQERIHRANDTFQYAVGITSSCFGNGYNEKDEETKIDSYMRLLSNLDTASSIYPFTSYYDKGNSNDEISNSLHYLKLCVNTPDKRSTLIIEKGESLSNHLTYIITNIDDKKSWQAVFEIAYETFTGIKPTF